jgi:hypothetical protein
VENVREQRERVAKTIARWQKPGLQRGWDFWLEYMDVREQERRDELLKLTHNVIYDENGNTKTYRYGLLIALHYDQDIETTLKNPTTAEDFGKAVVSELAEAVDIQERQISVLSYQRHEEDGILAKVVVHDWHEMEGNSKPSKSLETIVQDLQSQVQDQTSRLRRSQHGKKLQNCQLCGGITKLVHDSVQSSYTGMEVFQRLGEVEQEMANIEKDLHRALIKSVQHKRRVISRMMHIEKAVAFDTFLERIRSQSDSTAHEVEGHDRLAQAQQQLNAEIERPKRNQTYASAPAVHGVERVCG